jgi:hypothetical protein
MKTGFHERSQKKRHSAESIAHRVNSKRCFISINYYKHSLGTHLNIIKISSPLGDCVVIARKGGKALGSLPGGWGEGAIP